MWSHLILLQSYRCRRLECCVQTLLVPLCAMEALPPSGSTCTPWIRQCHARAGWGLCQCFTVPWDAKYPPERSKTRAAQYWSIKWVLWLWLPTSCAVLGERSPHSLYFASLFVCILLHILEALYISTGSTTGAVSSICTEQTQILEPLSAARGLSLAGIPGLYFCPDAAGETQLPMAGWQHFTLLLSFRLGTTKFLLVIQPSFHFVCMTGAKKAPPKVMLMCENAQTVLVLILMRAAQKQNHCYYI